MKYKVGDTVKIKSKEWYRSKANSFGRIEDESCVCFVRGMAKYTGQTCVISEVHDHSYTLRDMLYRWADYMFEDSIIEDIEFEEIAEEEIRPSSDDSYSWLF